MNVKGPVQLARKNQQFHCLGQEEIFSPFPFFQRLGNSGYFSGDEHLIILTGIFESVKPCI